MKADYESGGGGVNGAITIGEHTLNIAPKSPKKYYPAISATPMGINFENRIKKLTQAAVENERKK